MVWTVTLEVEDCETNTELVGASVLDGNGNTTSMTDANGRVTFTKNDSLSNL
jgi:hypothetical protein